MSASGVSDAPLQGSRTARSSGEGEQQGIGYHLRLPLALLRLYWLRVRSQLVQEALAALGIAVGVALIFAVETANTSIPASVRGLLQEVVGKASIEVGARSPEGVEQSLLNEAAEVPGVFGASGVLDSRITLIGPRGQLALTLFGADSAISAIGGPLPHRFSLRSLEDATPAPVQELAFANRLRSARPPTIALTEGPARAIGASRGQLLLLQSRGHLLAVLCGQVLGPSIAGSAAQSPLAIASLVNAQRITGLAHRLTRILVMPQKGQAAAVTHSLRQRFGDSLKVRGSDSEVSLLEEATRSSNQVAALFVALSVVVGLLFAYNAMLLTLPSRRRWITRLRNMGAHRHEVLGLLALEAVMLGSVASALGLMLGELLASAVFGGIPRYLTAGFPIGPQHVITALAVGAAIGGGLLTTIVASAGPTLGALRGKPLETPSDDEQLPAMLGILSGRAGALIGSCMLVVTGAIIVLAPDQSIVAFVALAIAVGCLIPVEVGVLVRFAERLTMSAGMPTGYVAAVELRTAPARAASVAATGAVAAFAVVALGGAAADIQRGVSKTIQSVYGASTVVVSPASYAQEAFQMTPFQPGEALRRIRAIPGVQSVAHLRGTFLDVGNRRLVVAVSPGPLAASQVIEGSPKVAAGLIEGGRWAALSAPLAREWHVALGDRFSLPTPSGNVILRLAATVTNYGWPAGALVLSPPEYERLWRSENVSLLAVKFRPGVKEPQAVALTRAALRGTGLVATGRRMVEGDVASASSQGMSQLGQIATLVIVAAILAVVAVMAGSVWQRRPRLGMLRRLGMGRGELVQTIYMETAVIMIIGGLAGLAFGLIGQPLATLYVRQSTGFPVAYSPAVWLSVRTVLTTGVIATAFTGLLGYAVTRRGVGWGSTQ